MSVKLNGNVLATSYLKSQTMTATPQEAIKQLKKFSAEAGAANISAANKSQIQNAVVELLAGGEPSTTHATQALIKAFASMGVSADTLAKLQAQVVSSSPSTASASPGSTPAAATAAAPVTGAPATSRSVVPNTTANQQVLAQAQQKLAQGGKLTKDEQVVLHAFNFGWFTKGGDSQYMLKEKSAAAAAQAAAAGGANAASPTDPSALLNSSPSSTPGVANSAGVSTTGGDPMGMGASASSGPTGTFPTTSPGKGLSDAQLHDALGKALAPRQGTTLYLGRGGIINEWSQAKVASLNKGIQTAQQFFPNMSAKNLALLVVSEGAYESTGDTNLNVGSSDPGAGQGFMQVTPQSVVKDYQAFGKEIKAPDGSTVLSPKGPFDWGNVSQNVAMWAWYSQNSLAAGTSLAQHFMPNQPPNVASANKDYGNVMFTWNQGPSNDRHTKGASFESYYASVADFYVNSGFGSQADYDRLMATPTGDKMSAIKTSA
jgi:hypothetical protein